MRHSLSAPFRLASLCLAAISLLLAGCSHPPAAAENDPTVTTFLHHYFDSWSAKDMDAYGKCFADQARVFFLGRDGSTVNQGLTDFLHGQKLAHEESARPMTERPLDMKIQGDNRVKQAAVTWVLSKGGTEERGTDFFTLRHDGDQWKIVSLVFYGE